jgi:hypothetical protein
VVFFMADQVPFWVKIGARQSLFSHWERCTAESKRLRKGTGKYKAQAQKLQRLVDVEEKEAAAAKLGNHTQKRGATNVDQDKCRICLEARQVVRNYCKDGEDPIGEIIPSILTVGAAYARLSNIDADHKWIKDEKFYVGPKLVHHKAGQLTPCLYEYVELRKVHPELFVNIVLMGQPAACVDEILYLWSIEDVRSRYPYVLQLRDLLGCAFTDRAKAACRLTSTVNAWIAAGMTPALQLTDTDEAFILKRGSDHEKTKIVMEKKDEAKAEGGSFAQSSFRCGAYEIMRISNAGHQAMVDNNKLKQTVVAGMRRNGFFAWRPDHASGKLVRSDTQDWCKDQATECFKFKEGGHRLKDSWLNCRYEWLDDEGKPIHEDWSRCNEVSKANELGEPEEMKFFEQVIVDAKYTTDFSVNVGGKLLVVPVISLDFDGSEVFEAQLLEGVLKCPKVRRIERRAEHLKAIEIWKKKDRVGRKKLKIDYAMRDLHSAWHDGMEEDLKDKTVQEIFDLLLPRCGQGSGKAIEKQAKLKKDSLPLIIRLL